MTTHHRRHPAAAHLLAAAVLAVFVALLFARLLFTDRVLASGDILHYFYPYRDFASEALRDGRIPLWNPYIFGGVPFLANPQAAVLYPLHWPLAWLSVTKQIYWSAALHAWILALGGYALMRRLGCGWAAGVVTGLVLAGSGFYGGMIGHINQMNGAAWLPWMVWVLTTDRRPLTADRTTRNSQFATRNSQLATRNSHFATRNSHFATRNSQLAIRNSHFSLCPVRYALYFGRSHTDSVHQSVRGRGDDFGIGN